MAAELRLPGRVRLIATPLDTHVFNGGLAEAWGRLWTVYRVNRRPSLLGISELDGCLRPISTKILWGTWDPTLVPEDPRVIAHDGGLYLMWVGVNSHDFSKATICHGLVDADMRLVWKSPCWFRWQESCEKNWVPFVQDSALHCIYSLDPLMILRYQGGAWQPELLRKIGWAWKHGHMSGGAPPVRVGDRWYVFFHSSRLLGGVKVYYAGCCAFSDAWEPLGITPEPILAGATHVFVEPAELPWRPGSRVSAVFPCGAVLRGGQWLLSYGYLDAALRVALISPAVLDDALGLSLDPDEGRGLDAKCRRVNACGVPR
jgi:predicted GH43/DUF377 family glycosyl hydrolase